MNKTWFTLLILCSIILSACSSSSKLVTQSYFVEGDSNSSESTIATSYAHQLNVPDDSIKNDALYVFIDEWIGTPYLLGGADKSGLDCSFFAQKLYVDVYDALLPRTAQAIFDSKHVYLFKGKSHLHEGDLIFFKLSPNDAVSHIGIYLQNGRFVHSTLRKGKSKKNGVKISNLNDGYWSSIFYAAGKVKF